jgi:hypothetical protein
LQTLSTCVEIFIIGLQFRLSGNTTVLNGQYDSKLSLYIT